MSTDGPIIQSIHRLNAAAERVESAAPLIHTARLVLTGALDEIRAVCAPDDPSREIVGPIMAAAEHLDSAMADIRGAANKTKGEAIALGKVRG